MKVLLSAVFMEAKDGDQYGRKDTRVIDGLETMEASENGHIGIWASSL